MSAIVERLQERVVAARAASADRAPFPAAGVEAVLRGALPENTGELLRARLLEWELRYLQGTDPPDVFLARVAEVGRW